MRVDAPQLKAPTALPPIDAVTRADLAYLRAHGRNAEGYTRGRSVAERFGYQIPTTSCARSPSEPGSLPSQAAEVRLMFNNNRGGNDAPVAAERMRELLRA